MDAVLLLSLTGHVVPASMYCSHYSRGNRLYCVLPLLIKALHGWVGGGPGIHQHLQLPRLPAASRGTAPGRVRASAELPGLHQRAQDHFCCRDRAHPPPGDSQSTIPAACVLVFPFSFLNSFSCHSCHPHLNKAQFQEKHSWSFEAVETLLECHVIQRGSKLLASVAIPIMA